MPGEELILRPNLVLGPHDEQVRDILQDLHATLRAYKAELFYRHEQRSMLLMVADRSKEVGGQYRVVGLIKKIALAGTSYEKGHFAESRSLSDPVLQPNMIRPANFAQVEDIIKSMLAVLAKHCATLTFDIAKRGMILSAGGAEIAVVYNITRFGAEIARGSWRFDTVAPTFAGSAQSEAARLQAELARIRGGK